VFFITQQGAVLAVFELLGVGGLNPQRLF